MAHDFEIGVSELMSGNEVNKNAVVMSEMIFGSCDVRYIFLEMDEQNLGNTAPYT